LFVFNALYVGICVECLFVDPVVRCM